MNFIFRNAGTIINKMGGTPSVDYTVKGGGERVGWRCSHSPALPCHRAMAALPKRWLEEVAGEPAQSTMARPMDLIVVMVSSASPPRVSATRGMNSVPVERQAERLEANLRWTPTWRAWPGVKGALGFAAGGG